MGEANISGSRIKQAREKLGWGQSDLAAAIDVDFHIKLDQSDISEIERQKRGVKDFELDAIARVLQVKHVGIDTKGGIFYAADENEVIVTIGLEDVVVVRDGNVTLIVKKDRTQEIKQVIKVLGEDDKLKDLL